MRKVLVFIFALALIPGIASAIDLRDGIAEVIPVIADSGSTQDAYGYRWYDNDNGGSVPYSWKELSGGVGVPVTGLGDDNNAGWFQLGFDFPYYWYTVNRLMIGSNGYASFSSRANFAHPFSNIPYAGQPNDLLAVCAGDLDFSRGNPECYYWTNNADSFMVEWKNVGEYGYIDSLHTFEVVLDATDSSITYYYGPQQGRFLDSNGATRDVIGIEDISGTIGIQYLRDNLPTSNMFHNGLALRFHPAPDPNFTMHDVGIWAVFNDENGAVIQKVNNSMSVQTLVKNYGTEDEVNFNVICTITSPSLVVVYADTVTISPTLPAGQTRWVTFTPNFTPTAMGQYRVDCKTALLGDQVAANNTKRGELRSVDWTLNTAVDLLYDDNVVDNGRSWTGDFSGFGNEFTPPTYPIKINNVQTDIYSVTAPGNLHVWIMDDDGTGNPGNILAADTVMVSVSGWTTVDFSALNITINSGKVFAVAIHELQNTFAVGMDQTSTTPFSFRGWEYTGVLAGDRDREISDIMIRVNVTPQEQQVACCDVSMIPDTSPVIVPPGGSFGLTGIIANPTSSPIQTDVWVGVKYLTYFFQLWYFPNIPLNPGQFISAHMNQAVPGFAPLGTYTYIAYCGDRPTLVKCDSFSFPFTVAGARVEGGATEWTLEGGWNVPADIPSEYALIGSYPNPFNATATITYETPVAGNVSLDIYNLLGQKVATLVNGNNQAGQHNVIWDASSYSSGVYFYKLSAGDQVFTKRMTLLK
ncbi:MAG: hypothetical protein CO189_01375 [candidate division Zixibacteria bacterium CG_4_9_14_3_um_filter_46_8]|nr:MAG: hypothetical protein CO189_01375 [candidate division Zixibacteria bacterium CG_4_9_14_3_um_filter_46_8]